MCTSGFRNLRATNLPGPAKYPAMESPLSTWDVFHGDRLELERGLSAAAIREALARGDLRDDDLVRPAGTTVAWARLAELSEVLDSTPTPSDQPASPPTPFPTHAAQPTSTPTTDLPGDFEIQAADSAESPVPSIESPLPIQERFTLRPDSDVTFPVINDIPAEVKFLPGGLSNPVLPGSADGFGPSLMMKRTRKRKTRTSTATARASRTWLRMSSKSSTTRSMSAQTFQSGLSNTPPKNIAPVGPKRKVIRVVSPSPSSAARLG